MTTLDPITLTVIQNGLQQVCNEMDLAFVRAAFSPVISEALDRSDGIYHRDNGELIAQGELGLPVLDCQGDRERRAGAAGQPAIAHSRGIPADECEVRRGRVHCAEKAWAALGQDRKAHADHQPAASR